MEEEIKDKHKHTWTIFSFEQYQDLDGFRYCYIICEECGEVKRQKINPYGNPKTLTQRSGEE